MNIVFVISDHYPFGMAGTMRIKLFSEFLIKRTDSVKILISNQDNGSNKRVGKHNNVRYSTMLSDKFPRFIFYLLYPFLAFYQLISSRQKNNKNVMIIYGSANLFNLQFMIIGRLIGYKIILDIVEDGILSNENLSANESMSIVTRFHLWVSAIILPHIGWLIDGAVVISTTLMNKYKLLFQRLDIELIPCSAANLDFSYKRDINIGKKAAIRKKSL